MNLPLLSRELTRIGRTKSFYTWRAVGPSYRSQCFLR